MSLVYSLAIAIGGFILFIGAVILYVGMTTPEGKKVNMGLGTYYDRTGICFRAIMVILIGVVALIVGLLINV